MITPLPTPPSRTSPATFANLADAFLGALPTFATEANALQTDVNSKQVIASDAAAASQVSAIDALGHSQQAAAEVVLASQQVALATDQVSLATTQANLATTNGATQVALAADQVALATDQVALATTQANNSAISAAASEESRIQASKLNLGNKVVEPLLDNQGDPLLAGATYYDTTLNKWRVWTGVAWGDGISAISGVSSFNGQTGNVIGVSSVNGQTGIVVLPPTLPSFNSGVI